MPETFYFMRYNEVIGKASNLQELQSEMMRLQKENPESVMYHIREGHLNTWIESTGNTELSKKIVAGLKIDDVIKLLGEYNTGLKKGTPARKKTPSGSSRSTKTSTTRKKQ